MIKVTIADDHPLMLEGIKRVLSREIDIEINGEASNSGEVLAMLEDDLPSLLITDITMPGKSGLDMIKNVKALYPRLSILILSIHPEDRFAVRCIKAGACGYICKSTISKGLVNAVRKIVLEKRKYITPGVAEQLALQLNDLGNPLHTSLSDREFEVLCLIADGINVQHIAKKLSLSPHTIHTYRSRIKGKLNLSTNVEMARYAFQNDLIN